MGNVEIGGGGGFWAGEGAARGGGDGGASEEQEQHLHLKAIFPITRIWPSGFAPLQIGAHCARAFSHWRTGECAVGLGPSGARGFRATVCPLCIWGLQPPFALPMTGSSSLESGKRGARACDRHDSAVGPHTRIPTRSRRVGHCACGRQPPLLIKPQILEVRSAPLSALRVRLRSSADLIRFGQPVSFPLQLICYRPPPSYYAGSGCRR